MLALEDLNFEVDISQISRDLFDDSEIHNLIKKKKLNMNLATILMY